MATADLTDYLPIDKENLFFCIREKLSGKYVVRFNSNNELTIYFKDAYFYTDRFPAPLSDEVKYLYCKLDTREEMGEYVQILHSKNPLWMVLC